MGYIYYRLNRSSNLQGMAPPAQPGGGFGVALLPAGMDGVAGMYIIINCNGVENRYVGISTNIGRRFRTRMATVTELDIAPATLANIHVVWGRVKVRDHPPPGAAALAGHATHLVGGGTVDVPAWAAAGWTVAAPPGGRRPFVHMVDGGALNLEHLLIRFVMSRLGAGGTVSNNQLMAPFNYHPGPGGSPLIVKFHSGPFGNYNGYTRAAVMNPGDPPW